jgi:hypothetical protein
MRTGDTEVFGCWPRQLDGSAVRGTLPEPAHPGLVLWPLRGLVWGVVVYTVYSCTHSTEGNSIDLLYVATLPEPAHPGLVLWPVCGLRMGGWLCTFPVHLYTAENLHHRYLMSRLSLQVFYLWRHVYCRHSAAIYIMVVKFRHTICPPPPQLSPFIGGLRCQAILTEHGPYIAERSQNKQSLYCEMSMTCTRGLPGTEPRTSVTRTYEII